MRHFLTGFSVVVTAACGFACEEPLPPQQMDIPARIDAAASNVDEKIDRAKDTVREELESGKKRTADVMDAGTDAF